MTTKVAINGAAGRMGQRLVALCAQDEHLSLAAGTERPGHPQLGHDLGTIAGTTPTGLPLTDQHTSDADVLIDFTIPPAMCAALAACVENRCAAVIGTTGLTQDDHNAIDDAAKTIPVLQAPNMSLGVNLLIELVHQAAARLDENYDIEILETHHRFKKDAPSGTALALVHAACKARGKDPDKDIRFGTYGPNPEDAPRQPGQIGVHAMRMGDVVGEHTVRYAALGERLELGHVATNRDVFAHGALAAAKWLAHRPPARYTMRDILGF